MSQYKFKVGDVVKIIKSGSGMHPEDVGKVTTILKLTSDYYGEDKGYSVSYDGLLTASQEIVGEGSFELVKRKELYKIY